MNRLFTQKQKAALYEAASGKCENCGVALGVDWHADHIQPYSAGGETDVINGQALCRDCNLQKGSSVATVQEAPTAQPTDHLRPWQRMAFNRFQSSQYQEFMIMATPGAGKTTCALTIAKAGLGVKWDRIVIVVPTHHLRQQWEAEAIKAGLQLAAGDWNQSHWTSNQGEKPDRQGLIVTYQQVAVNPDLHRRLAAKRRTFVVFDEIHHAGDDLSWGAALRTAFSQTEKRLSLTGTPFRSDNSTIPFVNYEERDGGLYCKADVAYGYGEALKDSACRAVVFPSFDGQMEYQVGDQVFLTTFDDDLDDFGQSRRLNTAIDPDGGWLENVLKEAIERLDLLRTDHRDAGGLVITKDQYHARRVAALIHRISGYKPVIAISEDPDASGKIEAFNRGSEPWIVAVKMISEGVDIPRLRVGVYASNVVSVLFFRQAVGRFVRMIRGLDEQTAYFYLPEDPRLVKYALDIKKECEQAIREEVEEITRSVDRDEHNTPAAFVPLKSTAELGVTVADGTGLDPTDIERAKAIAAQIAGWEAHHPIEFLAKALTLFQQQEGVQAAAPAPVPVSLRAEEERLRQKCNRLVNWYSQRSGKHQKDINKDLMVITGGPIERATVQQLEHRLQVLGRWISEAKDGN